jgi:hypothetical protein
VAERLRIARAEARACLADTGRRHSRDERRTSPRLDARAHDEMASVRALRQAIFDTRAGACLSSRAFDRLYAHDTTSDPPDVATLAHLVSCAGCLDTVNRRLRLPLLVDRDPSDSLGRGSGSGTGTGIGSASGRRDSEGSGAAGKARLTNVLRARLEDAREDHPQELQIAVNGLFVGSQAVNGPMNEQCLKILVAEQVGFVEVFDEHGTCLLYLDVEPPPQGAVEQSARVMLSGGRNLSATLAFSDASPTVHVLYDNPSAAVAADRHAVVAMRDIRANAAAHEEEDEAATPVRTWSLWPAAVRFVLAGIIAGALLANPRQTLAAVDHARRLIVDSITRLFETRRPRAALPSRPVTEVMGITLAPSALSAASGMTVVAGRSPAGGEGASDIELSEITLKALRLLDGVEALTMEQVEVGRGADRRVHVQGVVGTAARRRELTAALRALPARRLHVDLATIDDASASRAAASTSSVRTGAGASAASTSGSASAPRAVSALRSAELTRDRVPAAYESVRRYIVSRAASHHAATPGAAAAATAEAGASANADVNETARRLSAALLSRSLQARVHGRTVQDLVTSVSAAEAARLPPSARATWRELVGRHAERFRQETASLRRELEQIFPFTAPDERGSIAAGTAPASDGNDTGANTDSDAWRTAAHLFTLASAHDIAVRRAFAVAADGHESLDVSTPEFRRSLLEAERLAAGLAAALPAARHDASKP